MGIKFQAHPRDDDSQIIIHVRMLDGEAALQQEALGIVGVNLLYGAFTFHHEPDLLVDSLLDGLSTSRVEIDMIRKAMAEARYNRKQAARLLGVTYDQLRGRLKRYAAELEQRPAGIISTRRTGR